MPSPVLALPPQAPRSGNSALSRWFARCVLRLGGWKMVGEWPDVPRLVLIVAPHSSAWDGVWALGAKVAMGLGIGILAKRELFFWPLGWLLSRMGCIPVDRSAPHGVIDTAVERLRTSERMWLVLAPEGTRRRVERWKSGFWQIARKAEVPVYMAWFHYPDKTIGIGGRIDLTDDMQADLKRIRALYAPYQGRNRGA